jgi:hypothetical protein
MIEQREANVIERLLAADQLKAAKRASPAMDDLYEGKITFFPTYKFNPGTADAYDSVKKRTPSYTDRVLVKTGPGRMVIGPATNFVFESDLVRIFAPDAPGFVTENCFSLEERRPTFPGQPRIVEYAPRATTFSDHKPLLCRMEFRVPQDERTQKGRFDDFIDKKRVELGLLARPVVKAPAEIVVELNATVNFEFKNVSIRWARWEIMVAPAHSGVSVRPTTGTTFPGHTAKVRVSATAVPPAGTMIMLQDKDGGTLKAIAVRVPA